MNSTKTEHATPMPAKPARRILIFSHYNPHGNLADHVLYTLRHCRDVFDCIVLVSNSNLTDDHRALLGEHVDRVVVRENTGFDFLAWKTSIQDLGWDTIREYDSLTLMNDTCFGPIADMAEAYQQMDPNSVDFWGLTSHPRSIERSKYFYRFVREHIQSYFMVFHQPVLHSRIFEQFWDSVVPFEDVWDVIVRYEMRLTQKLASAGFRFRPFVGRASDRSPGHDVNLAHYEPGYLIENGAPFVKIKSFIYSPQRHAAVDLLAERDQYPVALIENHIKDYFRPDLAARLSCRQLPLGQPVSRSKSALRVGVFLHVRNWESFARYRPHIDRMTATSTQRPDLYLMVSSSLGGARGEQEQEIRAAGVKGTLSCNEGEHPWVQHAGLIDGYDLVAYFNLQDVDRGEHGSAVVRDHVICRTLLAPTDQIVAAFEDDPKLGIVCADLPHSEVRKMDHPDRRREEAYLKQVASRVHCQRHLDWEDAYALLTPYGSSFWCRPTALRPLRALGSDPSIAHAATESELTDTALERLPVYIVWAEGYDYGLTVVRDRLYALQQVQQLREESQRLTFKGVTASCTWRLGHLCLCIPYYMVRAIRRIRQDSR